ncbi:FG-nucleoporin nsp1 [Coemansia sp. RSA 2607]|nr:FG-nucleoporin nsp1 [Coemansia sp. RSA 2607]KAJ2395223.1 FG-nucleoporin nsp1 [Coemansia sp. RSA 2603]
MFGGGSNNNSGASGGFNFGSTTGSSSLFGSAAASGDKSKTAFSGFGAPAASSAASGTPSIFGSSTATDAAKPATGFSFGTPTNTNASSGGLFSAANSASTSVAGNTAKPSEPQKPSFSFGSASATTGGSSLFGSTTATAAPSIFGAASAAPASTSTTSTAAPAASSSSSGGLFSFGAPAASNDKSDASAPATSAATSAAANPTTGTGLGGFKLSTTPVASSSTTTDTAKPADTAAAKNTDNKDASSAAPAAATEPKIENSTDLANAALRGKTLEEIVHMWTSELSEQTRAFHKQASTVGYWDRALVQQGKRITDLYEATMSVEAEQAALDQSLDHMEEQQNALQNLLDTYEGQVQDIVHKTQTRAADSKSGVGLTADEERNNVYSSAERLNTQLDELTRRLTTLVEDVNGITNASTGENDSQKQSSRAADPFAQIVQILNAHLSSLEWIDSQTEQLQERVKNAQRVHQEVEAQQADIAGNGAGFGAAAESAVQEEAAQARDSGFSIPGGFASEPLPPVTSSFGRPVASGNTNQRSAGWPFGSLFGRRGF